MGKIAGFIVAVFIATIAPSRPACAEVIPVGPYAGSTGTPFLLPVEVTRAIDRGAWSFDLAYDTSTLSDAAGCDPVVDPFCRLGDLVTLSSAIEAAPVKTQVPAQVAAPPYTLPEPAPVLLICAAFVLAMVVHRRREPTHGRLSLRHRAFVET